MVIEAAGNKAVVPETCNGVAAGRARSALRGVGFTLWVLGTTVPIVYLMASHWIPLPAAAATAEFVGGSTAGSIAPRWQVIHVLASGCPCSTAVADYLV